MTGALVLVVMSLIQAVWPAHHWTSPNLANTQERSALEAFLDDPVQNFGRIKDIQDLCAQIVAFDLDSTSQGRGDSQNSYMKRLYRSHFREVNEKEIEIVIFLFGKLHTCRSDIFEHTMRVFVERPRMFVAELEKTKDWKDVITGISQDWKAFSQGLVELGSTEFEKAVKEYAISTHEVAEERLNDIESFLNDPITNFDRIKQIKNLCNLIDRYEQNLLKNQSPTVGVLTVFFNRHFGEVDEMRAKIVIHMILHCGSGIQGEILIEKAAILFCAQPQMFVKVLEKTEDWKMVICDLFYLGDISKGLEKLGNSRFEMKIKEYVKELEKTGHSFWPVQKASSAISFDRL